MSLKVASFPVDPFAVTNEEPTAAPIPPQRPGQTPVPPVQPPTVAPPTPAAPPSQAQPNYVPAQAVPTQAVPVQAVPTQAVPVQAVPAAGQRQAVVGQPEFVDQFNQSPAAETTEIVRKSNTGMRLGLAGALLAVTGLGGFAVKTALSEPAGPETPEEAMEAFFEAFANEDLVGMAETLLPSEREAYVDPVLSLTDELERLEIFGKDVEIDTLGTLEVSVEGLVVQSTPLAEGFAMVESTSGTLHVVGGIEDVEAARILGEWLGEDPEQASDEVSDLAEEPLEMVAVQEEGVWYLSLAYSSAEAIRKDADKPLPSFGAGPTPVGGATPEAAIENFVNEMVDLDLEGMLTQLDPEEMRALYDYAPLFMTSTQNDIDDLLNEMRAEGVSWGVTDLQLHTDDSRGRTIVLFDGATFGASFGDNEITLVFAGDCVSVRASGEMVGELDESFCEGDELAADEIAPLADLGLDDIEFPQLGITVVQRGDNWYVSSAPTILFSIVDVLAVLEPADVDTLKDAGSDIFEQLNQLDPFALGGFGQSQQEQFIEIEDAIVDTEGGYANGDDDDYETNFVEVNPLFVPDGNSAYADDTVSWWLSVDNGLEEPASLMTVWTGDDEPDTGWTEVAEYPTVDAAIRAMDTLSGTEFVGDQNSATDNFYAVRRSGRFLVLHTEGIPAYVRVADKMVAHLVDL